MNKIIENAICGAMVLFLLTFVVFIQVYGQSFNKFKVGSFFVKNEHVYRIISKNRNVITVREGYSEYFEIDLEKESLLQRIDCVVEEGLDPLTFIESRNSQTKTLDTL